MPSFRAYLVGAATLSMVAACSFDQSGIGSGGDGGGQGAADAQRFDADPNAPDATPGQPDAFVPDPPDATPPDFDNDGVPDADDNCPMDMNPDQYDEDADDVGDECDNCPHIKNTDQADVGEANNSGTPDGVGDVCDPRPEGEGDAIAVFDGFNGNTLDPMWIAGPSSGTNEWALSGDGYLLQPSASVASRALLWNGDIQVIAAVDTALEVDAIAAETGAPDDNSRTVGPLGAFADGAGSGTGYACFQFINPNLVSPTNFATMAEFDGNGWIGNDSQGTPWDLETNERYTYRMYWHGIDDEQECTVDTASDDPQSASDSDTTYISGIGGLRTYGVSARFEYFVLYDLSL